MLFQTEVRENSFGPCGFACKSATEALYLFFYKIFK